MLMFICRQHNGEWQMCLLLKHFTSISLWLLTLFQFIQMQLSLSIRYWCLCCSGSVGISSVLALLLHSLHLARCDPLSIIHY